MIRISHFRNHDESSLLEYALWPLLEQKLRSRLTDSFKSDDGGNEFLRNVTSNYMNNGSHPKDGIFKYFTHFKGKNIGLDRFY
jgi:hypothetical protein